MHGPLDPYLGGRDTTAPPDGDDCPQCGAGSFDGRRCPSCHYTPHEHVVGVARCDCCGRPLDGRRSWRRLLDGSAAHDTCLARDGR